jgi:hypothetical protein
VEQIAKAVGYQDTAHFFHQFRQLHGTTPLVWRSRAKLFIFLRRVRHQLFDDQFQTEFGKIVVGVFVVDGQKPTLKEERS